MHQEKNLGNPFFKNIAFSTFQIPKEQCCRHNFQGVEIPLKNENKAKGFKGYFP